MFQYSHFQRSWSHRCVVICGAEFPSFLMAVLPSSVKTIFFQHFSENVRKHEPRPYNRRYPLGAGAVYSKRSRQMDDVLPLPKYVWNAIIVSFDRRRVGRKKGGNAENGRNQKTRRRPRTTKCRLRYTKWKEESELEQTKTFPSRNQGLYWGLWRSTNISFTLPSHGAIRKKM